jgi:hypothetical protein
VSEVSYHDSNAQMARLEDALNAFCLDLGKVEGLASKMNGGIACRIRRAGKWERATFWKFKVYFVNGVTWDVIIPYPYPYTSVPVDKAAQNTPFQIHAGKIYGNRRPPKIISWRASSDNPAGVAYFFIKSISGYSSEETC